MFCWSETWIPLWLVGGGIALRERKSQMMRKRGEKHWEFRSLGQGGELYSKTRLASLLSELYVNALLEKLWAWLILWAPFFVLAVALLFLTVPNALRLLFLCPSGSSAGFGMSQWECFFESKCASAMCCPNEIFELTPFRSSHVDKAVL